MINCFGEARDNVAGRLIYPSSSGASRTGNYHGEDIRPTFWLIISPLPMAYVQGIKRA